MAKARSPNEGAGLVVGVCRDTATYHRLASTVVERGLTSRASCAAGTEAAIFAAARDAGGTSGEIWRKKILHFDHLEGGAAFDAHNEPLLEACFACLSAIPSGSAPWQGSWRGNSLAGVIKALENGAIIFVVEAQSIEEQRNWARALLKSGCALVQTHGGAAPEAGR